MPDQRDHIGAFLENTWRLTPPRPPHPGKAPAPQSPHQEPDGQRRGLLRGLSEPEPQRGRWRAAQHPLSPVGPHPPARFTAQPGAHSCPESAGGQRNRPLPEYAPITARARTHMLVGRCVQRSPAPRPIASQLQRAVRRALEGRRAGRLGAGAAWSEMPGRGSSRGPKVS